MSRLEKLKQRFELMSSIERKCWSEGKKYIAGVDEVGRGPLAGPVVAAAVVLPEDFDEIEVNDSKKLSEKKRNELYKIIKEKSICYSIASVGENKIDEINILNATKLAMHTAIADVRKKLKEKCGVDLDKILVDAVRLDGIDKEQEAIVKGDTKSISIAAASILAKVSRDRLMIKYDEIYSGYGFASNKGYGTKAHYDGIAKLGITPIHRKSFLKKILNK